MLSNADTAQVVQTLTLTIVRKAILGMNQRVCVRFERDMTHTSRPEGELIS